MPGICLCQRSSAHNVEPEELGDKVVARAIEGPAVGVKDHFLHHQHSLSWLNGQLLGEPGVGADGHDIRHGLVYLHALVLPQKIDHGAGKGCIDCFHGQD